VWRAQVASLTLPVRAAGRSSAMQADKSVLCAQAAGASKALASTRAVVNGLDGRGVMKKSP
jgi:hypothetical protein